MKTKEFILEQLGVCRHKKNGWSTPLSDAIRGLSAEDAVKHSAGDTHSVYQIVNHLIFWNERWLMRLKGEVPPKMEIENPETFSKSDIDETKWKEDVKKLDTILTGFEERLKAMSETDLSKEAFEGYGASWYDMFVQTIIHNAYHTGQIVQLRKLQGTWDPEFGVS
ncbi:MAG: DinB family protein [Ignavibacteria bacterium]|nr:DinB family protein [Ignavibacteria bacterium]